MSEVAADNPTGAEAPDNSLTVMRQRPQQYDSGRNGNAGRSPWGAFSCGLNFRRRGRHQEGTRLAGSKSFPETA
jgi:hypothetical protein